MTFEQIVSRARDKTRFDAIERYLEFARALLASKATFVQAEIVCQNEPSYRFWQLPSEAGFAISRPLNSALLCSQEELNDFERDILRDLASPERLANASDDTRSLLCRTIYTVQQMIGVALDGLPSNEANFARKINGDLFERLMQLLFKRMGLDCKSAPVKVPVIIDGVEQCQMSFQHDLVLMKNGKIALVG